MKYILFYLAVINAATMLVYGIDKYKACHKAWRIPEKTLIGLALLGGSIGALFGMVLFHHKTRKPKFLVGVPFILILQVVFVVAGFMQVKSMDLPFGQTSGAKKMQEKEITVEHLLSGSVEDDATKKKEGADEVPEVSFN